MTLMRKVRACAVAGALAVVAGHASAADGPLAALSGSWAGSGSIVMSDGGRESLRCRVVYAIGSSGASASQDMRCASSSYRVDIHSDIAVNGSALSGTWSETSRGVSGQISGRINGPDIAATINAPVFSAGLTIATRGRNQAINIRVSGGDIASVNMNLKR